MKYQILPDLTPMEFEALKADIAQNGVLVPVEVDENGEILDGHHRVQAWNELAREGYTLPDYPRIIRAGMTEEQKRNHARRLNVMRRQLTREGRAAVIQDMRRDGMTLQAIADAVGVGRGTVHRIVENSDFPIGKSEITNERGQTRPATYTRHEPPAVSDFWEDEPYDSVEMAKAWGGYSEEYERDDEDEISQDRKDEIDFARTLKPHVADNIKDGYRLTAANHIVSDTPGYDGDEWYTPTEFIDAARNVMGTIDLDPASCIEAQSTINAAHFFTKDDDGLSMGWFGNVWLNPPYSNPLINQFVEKLIDEYESERINSAIILTNNSSDTKWFHLLLSRYPACFIRGRVHFWRQNHDTFGARQGQTIFYLGKDILKFETHFSGLGQVVMKI